MEEPQPGSRSLKKIGNDAHKTNIKEIKMPNGAIYRGEVKDGKPHGRGTMLYSNSQRYEGQFWNGLKHGKGKYYYLKGELYIGDWEQNKKQGSGQYFYEDGKRYTGEFKNNKKDGKGRVDEDDGSYYEGYFLNNDRDRGGEYYDAVSNKKYMLIYENGKKVSEREIIDIPIGSNTDLEHPALEKKESKKQKSFEQAYKTLDGYNMNDFKVHSPTNFASEDPFIPSLRTLGKIKVEENQQNQLQIEDYFDKQLITKRINEWKDTEISQWLNQIGFGDLIEEFHENKIFGDTLLILENQDLKDLNVGALGDRRILLREIEFLKLIFKNQCLGDSISKLYQYEVTMDLVRELAEKRDLRNIQKENLIKAVEQASSSSTSSDQEHGKEHHKIGTKNMQKKLEEYMINKGIRLTFLIPKEQIQIIKPIGRGGYGQVYLGKWLGQYVAVKKYLKKQGFRNKHVGHFMQEVQVINRLLHPCVVLYMGMCIYDNEYGMVTEFLSGGSLFDWLHKKHKRLNEETIFYILKDVAMGMSYLHGKNVLHCDLKSSNVLIDENWNVKLCDFGLSRIRTTKTKKKHTNLRVGTPHWMAPEILKGEKYECESDVYSFGILLWEMLTGQIPYKELSTAQIIGLVGNDENHHISIPNYPNKAFLQIFLSCTDRDIQKRPAFKVIVEALEKEEHKYRNN